LGIGCLILSVGGVFAQDPPQKQVPTLDYFLTSGSATVPDLGLNALIWVFFHFVGMFVLVFVAKSMLFLGLGTVAMAYEGSWLDRWTSRETRNPPLTVLFITLFGIVGVLLVGGWGFDLIPLYFKFINGGR
jgi:hypothetical protein